MPVDAAARGPAAQSLGDGARRGAEREAEKLGIPFLGAVPLHMEIRARSDAGQPIVAANPDSVHAGIYRDIAAKARAANAPALGETGDRLEASIADLETATEWLLATLAGGKQADALAGATPYQRLFGLVLTGAYLAKGALADGGDGRNAERAALCRFAAENVIGETAALKDRVMTGAQSLEAARSVLG